MRTSVQLLAAVGLLLGLAGLTGCSVRTQCARGLVDCGDYCADLSSDETDCGACGAPCAVGDYCDQGVCIVGTCLDDNVACNYDSQCCSNYCASDGLCGCIPTGNSGCATASDCCSGRCARDGVCD